MFDKFRDECGVVAIYGHPEASKLAYLGLYALQHRGQESAGGGGYNREGDRNSPAHHHARRLGNRGVEDSLCAGLRIACSISFMRNAEWWRFTATRKHPSWPTWASTPCSIAARRGPASAPATGSGFIPTSRWGTWRKSSPARCWRGCPANWRSGTRVIPPRAIPFC